MEPPVTPKPMPASAAKLPLDHTNKLFGISATCQLPDASKLASQGWFPDTTSQRPDHTKFCSLLPQPNRIDDTSEQIYSLQCSLWVPPKAPIGA
ncbi:hypothetical protein DSO57_1033046 [Entomophthora muscae]|uniref:Uncharacterized protein n=1 Tax=Entomophthora muscae TaxID=34485 RepID=A0ACC2RR40_9FUNG|nr:hypothetical protein DSO57_1033046 [Entomophthora muscae]